MGRHARQLGADAALAPADVIRRHVKRTLPVDVTDEEMLEDRSRPLAQRAAKETEQAWSALAVAVTWGMGGAWRRK